MSEEARFFDAAAVDGGVGVLAGAAVSIRDLRVVRGGATILHGISLAVPRGGVFGLVGPSGSGKTTLIRAVLGRQQIAGGEIRIDGAPAGTADLRARIGYMPQSPAVYGDLTGRENLDFFGRIYRIPPARVDEVLGLVDLRDVAERAVATYSGGQVQRVALAAALLPAPPLLLLDEPTVGLDPRLRRRLWSQFRELAAGGATLLVSTHVADEAANADRIVFLADGRLVAAGAPAELLARTGARDLEGAILRIISAGAEGGER
jgi:ABC-2 type transport system ATP-binding protein